MGGLDVASATERMPAARPRVHAPPHDAETVAWLVAIPGAVLAAAVGALLAKPVGTLLFPPLQRSEVWRWEAPLAHPEPQEPGAYVLMVCAAVLLAAAVFVCSHRPARLAPGPARRIAVGAQLGTVGFLVACLVTQYRLQYGLPGHLARDRIFTPATLGVGALLAALAVAGIRYEATRARAVTALRERPAQRRAATTVAIVATAIFLLHAINTETSALWAHRGFIVNFPYAADETFAVMNGLTPYVGASPLYASLWPLVTQVPLVLVGKTVLVFTATMCTLTGIGLVSIFGVLRRATESALGALLLYLPFLATSLFRVEGSARASYTPAVYFADFPLRYAGPLLLAWLTARALGRPGQGRRWALFLAGGLVALNNSSFGLPAFGGVVAALALSGPKTPQAALSLAREAGIGVALALVALCTLTLARAGTLPDLGSATVYPPYFLRGLIATPINSVLGLHLVLYVTYAAGLTTAVVRWRNAAPGRVLTGMLAWSGVFGLGTLGYFVAESGPLQIKAILSPWALTIALLGIVVVRRLARAALHWPTGPELAVLVGLGVTACSAMQVSLPWVQIERLTATHADPPPLTGTMWPGTPEMSERPFVASVAFGLHAFYLKQGAPVALLIENGHRIADAYGVVNVSGYSDISDMFAPSFLDGVVAHLRAAGGNTVVLTENPATEEFVSRLSALGFGMLTESGVRRVGIGTQFLTQFWHGDVLLKMVDMRNLRPRALRDGRGTLVAHYG